MSKPEPQQPPEHTLRRLTGTRIPGGTTSAAPGADAPPGAGAARTADAAPATDAAGATSAAHATGPAEPVAPLLPARARRPAVIAAACCAVVVGVLGALAAGRSQGNAVDRPVDSWLRHHLASHPPVLSYIGFLGGGQMTAVLTAILVLVCLLTRRVNGAILAVISVVVATGLTESVLKRLVHETLNGGLTYPSGHLTSVFALTGVVGVLLVNPPHHRPRPLVRLAVVLGLVAVGCVVAVAMIELEYHYFTDTIAGAAWGTCVALAATFLLDRAGVRRRLGAASPRWLKPEPPA